MNHLAMVQSRSSRYGFCMTCLLWLPNVCHSLVELLSGQQHFIATTALMLTTTYYVVSLL